MTILKTLFITTLFPFMIATSSDTKTAEYTLQGTVANKETGKPLANVYLYTVKGEEEAITNAKGEFRFVTWKKLPVTIHIHKENEEVRVVVSNPSEFIKIKL
jgi:uncharacterized protein YfaS (alpha-2-macroglobulin family)